MIDEILLQGADPNAPMRGGQSPLALAGVSGQYDVAAALLAGRADPNMLDGKGQCALHQAAIADQLAIVQLLLESGARASTLTLNGETALQLAVSQPVRQLLQHADQRGAGGAPFAAAGSMPRRNRPGRDDDDDDDDDDEEKSAEVEEDATAPRRDSKSGKMASGQVVEMDGPPPYPVTEAGDDGVASSQLPLHALVSQLQRLLASSETNVKKMLCTPMRSPVPVQCDVVRVGSSNK